MGRSPLLLLLSAVLSACPAEQPPEQRPDPSVAVLDRLVEQNESSGAVSLDDCLARARRSTCFVPAENRRSFPLRIAIDPRYTEHWPAWKERLLTTLGCVNQLYRDVGTSWTLESAEPWNPGEQRHNLRALLLRIQRDYPADLRSIVVGISVWDERRIYSQAGGEIGISQHAACVIPSWPRLENDCLTLAHELGHIMGARHVPARAGKSYIMAWSGHTFHLPAGDAVARVMATHRFDPRNIDVMRLYHRARFTPLGLKLPGDCSARVDAVDRCFALAR